MQPGGHCPPSVFPVSPSDDRFAPCRDCFTGYLASHLRTWKTALSRGRLPATPIGHIGRQIGNTCRQRCGPTMPSNAELVRIRELVCTMYYAYRMTAKDLALMA